jgi:hypothetical protein
MRDNEIADELARGGSAVKFVGPKPVLGVSRQDVRRIRRWLVNRHWVLWRGLGNAQRQTPELILGPCVGDKARFLSLTVHNPGLLLVFSLDIIP